MRPPQRALWWLLGLVGASALAAVIAYWAASHGPQHAPDWGGDVQPLVRPTPCDPTQVTCEAQGRDLRLALRLRGAVSPLRPFQVVVRPRMPQDLAVEAVVVAFVMPGMDMGPNRYPLSGRDGVWMGEARLPVCSSGRLDWVAEVYVLTDRGAYRGEFPFRLRHD